MVLILRRMMTALINCLQRKRNTATDKTQSIAKQSSPSYDNIISTVSRNGYGLTYIISLNFFNNYYKTARFEISFGGGIGTIIIAYDRIAWHLKIYIILKWNATTCKKYYMFYLQWHSDRIAHGLGNV